MPNGTDQKKVEESYRELNRILNATFPKLSALEEAHKAYVNKEAEQYRKNKGEKKSESQFVTQEFFQYISEKTKEDTYRILNERGLNSKLIKNILSGEKANEKDINSFLEKLNNDINTCVALIGNAEFSLKETQEELRTPHRTSKTRELQDKEKELKGQISRLKETILFEKSLQFLLKNDFFEFLRSTYPSAQNENLRFPFSKDISRGFQEKMREKMKNNEMTQFEKFALDNLDIIMRTQNLKDSEHTLENTKSELAKGIEIERDDMHLARMVSPIFNLFEDVNKFPDKAAKKNMEASLSDNTNTFEKTFGQLNDIRKTLLPKETSDLDPALMKTLKADLDKYIKDRSSKWNSFKILGIDRKEKVKFARQLQTELAACHSTEQVRKTLTNYLDQDWENIKEHAFRPQKGAFANAILKALDTIQSNPKFSESQDNPWNPKPPSNAYKKK